MSPNRRTFLFASAAGALCAQDARTDIFQAAKTGDVARATLLLDAAPELVRTRSAEGLTPLHYAAAAGKPDMVVLLGTRGAELSAGPESPLLAALDFPDHEAAKAMAGYLLGNASDPNARTRDGRTALDIARARGYTDLAALLIHRGAAGPNPDRIEIAWFGRRYLQDLHGRPVRRDDLNGLPWTLVNDFARVAHFDFDKVKQLHRDHPGLIATRASWDELAVEAGAHMGRLDIAGYLADAGAPVSTCTAVMLGQERMVREALAADRRTVCERGAHDIGILAYTAYANQQAEIADQLLQGGADVHARSLGTTTLHVAASKGYVELGEVLIAHGADVHATAATKAGPVTPLDLAVRNQQGRMEQFLKDKGGLH
jgi:ankyrin repeat protein